jgi:hypothetical protein
VRSRHLARWVFAPVFLLALLVLAEPAFAQCSMCKSVLAQSPEGQAMAGELNKAILVMFVAPYVVFGSFTAYFFRGRIGDVVRRALRTLVFPR